ncbi:hypothetical protein M408DRAFT_332391 [Serendipita vermifera MAFF 305830]|uniref:Uncharacterized protein n=1 Tax=Serendipita vermifera MAFF 305830 TaxID=933852 RepID=A0A0C2X1N3_SERVB|nr:hypothetical protein M408DRAFT_332391 [Serendipita vermifera MAFF 305830]
MSHAVWSAADAAIRTLRDAGYPDVCFVGGVACSLHGNIRTPKDLDILILNTSDDQETIKRRIVLYNPSFYLVASKKLFATYKVLWYRSTYGSVKVDILLPGIMDIPSFPASRIDTSNVRRFPSAPLSITLLLKLQAWSQHRAATEWYYSKEQDKDKTDLECLVPLAAKKALRPKRDVDLSKEFLSAAEKRVSEYLRANPSSCTRDSWRSMGFAVPEAQTVPTPRGSVASTSFLVEEPAVISRIKVKPLPRPRPLYTYGSSRY